jgi:hypothetical protein
MFKMRLLQGKPTELRLSNVVAAKGVSKSMQLITIRPNCRFDNFLAIGDAVRTTLGPKGMDKMVEPVLASSS